MKRKKAKDFFTAEERERIRQAVAVAEAHTSGEIATMVVDHSDSYREAEILGALLVAGLFSVIVAVAVHHVMIWSYIPLVCIFFFPIRYLFRRYPHLKLPFVGRKRIGEAVRERAIRAFFEKSLHKTREENGILIFISLLERKVWILGDVGINERIEPSFWRHFAVELSRGLKEDRACEVLCGIITACGTELARHFPRKSDDTNELTDEIMT